jgi:ferredoxin, 2Fe-2S
VFKVTFVDAPGHATTIAAPGGRSLMEVAVENGVSGIEGMCGGGCACGTCHVVIDPVWISKVGLPSEMELALLSEIAGTTSASRLACQLKLTQALDGLIVTTPTAQR